MMCTAVTRQRAASASESDSITLAGPVSPRTLNAACLLRVHNNTDRKSSAQLTLRCVCLPPL